jgi:hypothetical protein
MKKLSDKIDPDFTFCQFLFDTTAPTNQVQQEQHLQVRYKLIRYIE